MYGAMHFAGEGAYATVNLCVMLPGASMNKSFSWKGSPMLSSLKQSSNGAAHTSSSHPKHPKLTDEEESCAHEPALDPQAPQVAVKYLKPVRSCSL
jgi:hypothetical protein